jgi:biopolymer transport protein TolR
VTPGPYSDEGSGGDDLISEINVTPMVDIMLVLLIIFMVTATYIVKPSIEVELPRVTQADKVVQSTVTLTLRAGGEVLLDGRAIGERALYVELRAAAARNRALQAILSGDAAVPHGRVVRLIDILRRAGVTRFAINVQVDEGALKGIE